MPLFLYDFNQKLKIGMQISVKICCVEFFTKICEVGAFEPRFQHVTYRTRNSVKEIRIPRPQRVWGYPDVRNRKTIVGSLGMDSVLVAEGSIMEVWE